MGLIKALRTFHREARNAPGMDPRTIENAALAIELVGDLLWILPPGRELAASLATSYATAYAAGGSSRRIAQLRRGYMQVEGTLSACKAFTLSSNPVAVRTARKHFKVLQEAMEKTSVQIKITHGDELSTNFQGASARASLPGGGNVELNLRRIHPELDAGLDADIGAWILEGGAWSRETGEPAGVEMIFGEQLPPDEQFAEQLEATFRKLISAAGGGVKVVQIAGPAEALSADDAPQKVRLICG